MVSAVVFQFVCWRAARAVEGLEKRTPELLTVAREAVGRVRTMLEWPQPPQCCRDTHFRSHPCGCVCHGARIWLESLKPLD